MVRLLSTVFDVLAFAAGAQAATLTITPDKQVYDLGENIILNIFGDAEGSAAGGVTGTILFDAVLADYMSSSQQPLTSFGGRVSWALGLLEGGEGFGDAFNQLVSVNPTPVDGPLIATLVLLAKAPGTLEYSWREDLWFFHPTTAPGGSVTIVPEPSTALLVALGLLAIGRKRRSR